MLFNVSIWILLWNVGKLGEKILNQDAINIYDRNLNIFYIFYWIKWDVCSEIEISKIESPLINDLRAFTGCYENKKNQTFILPMRNLGEFSKKWEFYHCLESSRILVFKIIKLEAQ